MKLKKITASIGVAIGIFANLAHGEVPAWHWDAFGTTSYSGQIALADDQGVNTYQRFNQAASPSLFGAASVESPLMVLAGGGGSNVQVDTVRSGIAVPKITCGDTETLEFHGAITGACDSGLANNLQGIYVTATQTATTLTPTAWVFISGSGWKAIATNHPCGVIMSVQQCRKP